MGTETMDLTGAAPQPQKRAARGRKPSAPANSTVEPTAAAASAPAQQLKDDLREAAPLVARPADPAQGGWTREQMDLCKRTVAKDLTDDEFALFMHVSRRTGLDPIAKQIHAVKRNTKRRVQKNGVWVDEYVAVMTIQTGIDGFRLIADRTGRYAPGRAPTFVERENATLYSATAYVKKQTKDGSWHEVEATAYFDEYVSKNKEGKPTDFWARMPHGQLAKCAEALALRKGFPARLSYLRSDDEMGQADDMAAGVPVAARTTNVHDLMQLQRKAQDEAAEGPAVDVGGGGGVGEAGRGTAAEPASPAPVPVAAPARAALPPAPGATRANGAGPAAGMVSAIRENAKKAGLYSADGDFVDVSGELAKKLGVDEGGYAPATLAARPNASAIASALFALTRPAAPAGSR